MTQKISIAEQRAMGSLFTNGRRSLRSVAEAAVRSFGETKDRPPAKSKYNARKTTVDGITFDSAFKAERYSELVLLQRAGHITDLRLQVPFDLAINGVKVCKYIADFVYVEYGKEIVEDVKGMATDVYRIKRKLMLVLLKSISSKRNSMRDVPSLKPTL